MSADGVSEFCGLKKGRYTLTASHSSSQTDPDGTPGNGIVIDYDPKTPHGLSGVALLGGAWVVVPATVLKGQVAGRELVLEGDPCSTRLRPFKAYRFALMREPDGLRLQPCTTRMLDEDEIKTMVRAPAPAPSTPTPAAAPTTPAPPPKSDSGGCSAGRGAPGGPGTLLAAIFLAFGVGLRRRQRVRGRPPGHTMRNAPA